MAYTFVFLQVVNVLTATLALFIYHVDVRMWQSQGIWYVTILGAWIAFFTLVLLGFRLVASKEPAWLSLLAHLLFATASAGVHFWVLFTLARNMGLLDILRG